MIQIKNTKKPGYGFWTLIISLLVNSIFFIMLQISSYSFWQLLSLKIFYAFINMGIIYAVIGTLYIFTNRIWLSELIFGSICIVYSVINIYVVEFHGSPLTIPEFANTRTALNVIDGYSFIVIRPLKYVCVVTILSLINIFLINRLKRIETVLVQNQRQKSMVTKLVKKNLILIRRSSVHCWHTAY